MNGNEPPNHYQDYESRIIGLESSVEEILRRLDRMQVTIDEGFRQIRQEFSDLRKEYNELRKEVLAERRWLVGAMLAGMASLAAAILQLASKF